MYHLEIAQATPQAASDGTANAKIRQLVVFITKGVNSHCATPTFDLSLTMQEA